MNTPETPRWVRSLIITLFIFGFFSFYLFLRRGYYNLGIINKSLGSAAAVIAGLTLCIGPLARAWTKLSTLTPLRRSLGLFAFVLAIAHTIISAFFLPNRFSLPWFLTQWPAVLAGLIAVTVWIYLSTISHDKAVKTLGSHRWITHQQYGAYIAFAGIYLHLILLKYNGWIEWFEGKTQQSAVLANPHYPPASLFVFAVMTAIIVYRIILLVRSKK